METAIEIEYQDEQDPEVRGPWQIQNLQTADWALSRMAQCAAEAEAIEEQAKAAISAIKSRAEQLTQKATRGSAYFEAKLLEYLITHRNEVIAGKKKSRDFIHGRLGFRAQGGRLTVIDKAALEAWLMTQPAEVGLYRVKVEPEMRALQSLFKTNGEIPPGCDLEPETEEPYVKAALPTEALAKEE